MPKDRLPRLTMALVALFYLAIALARMEGVWADPSSILLLPDEDQTIVALGEADQWMVLATITDNARRLLHRPASFLDSGACHPFPHSFTLGEHMWGGGLLAALPLAVSGEPIFAYNVMLVLLLWFAALAMFAFCFDMTRSVPAALVAGLLFELFRPRLSDPAHPYIYSDFWTVLALLFLYRLFARGDWRSAFGLAFFGALQLGESLYPILAAMILLGVSAVFLGIVRRDVLLDRLPKLVFCAAVAGLAAWFVFGPYLAATQTWGVLEGRASLLLRPDALLPGRRFFPGLVIVVLATVGLLDRLRGARGDKGCDPRLALFVAGFGLVGLSVYFLPIPFTESRLWSPMPYLQSVVPGLSAVRAISSIGNGAYLALAVLAAYGVLALTDRLPSLARIVVAAALVVASVAEASHPSLARASFGGPLPTIPGDAALPDEDRRLLRSLGGATVLDYPVKMGNLLAHAHYLRGAVEHAGRTGACYNSFDSPMASDISQLGRLFPDPAAADALAALGFEVVVVHADELPALLGDGLPPSADGAPLFGGRFRELGRTRYHAALALDPPKSITSDWSALEPRPLPLRRAEIVGPDAEVRFVFRNRSAATFLHPPPLEPSPLIVRWFDDAGHERFATPTRALLPIAVGPGGDLERRVTVAVSAPPGDYSLRLARAERPDDTLAVSPVRVAPAPAPP